MSKILFAWELGGGLGHLTRAKLLAQVLRDRGHEPVFVFQDLSRIEALFQADGFPCFQAPLWMGGSAVLPPAATFAEILFRFGYLEPEGLLGLVRAWRGLFELLRPDLLIADHAPTALLAARGLPMRRVMYGSSFSIPPRLAPMPSFRAWEKVDQKRIEQSESKALSSVNEVLQRLGQSPLKAFMDLFETDEDFLCTWPELDRYKQRSGACYWGPTMMLDQGVQPIWPMGDAQRIFAYLKSDFAYLDPLLQALKALPYRTLVYAKGISPTVVSRFQSANLAFSSQPVDMEAVRRQAELIVTHGGDATVAAALLAGKPLMVLPMHAEQYGAGRNIEQLGAGLNVAPERVNPDYRKLFKRLLGEASFRQEAEAFSRKYSDFDTTRQIEQIADRCEELLN